jgi:hypothetical protein
MGKPLDRNSLYEQFGLGLMILGVIVLLGMLFYNALP